VSARRACNLNHKRASPVATLQWPLLLQFLSPSCCRVCAAGGPHTLSGQSNRPESVCSGYTVAQAESSLEFGSTRPEGNWEAHGGPLVRLWWSLSAKFGQTGVENFQLCAPNTGDKETNKATLDTGPSWPSSSGQIWLLGGQK